MSIFPVDNAEIIAASLLMLYCSFSPLILLPFAIISFDILSKRFVLTCEGLSDARVSPITKEEYCFAVHFYTDL